MTKDFTGWQAMGVIGSPVTLITSAFEEKANVTTVNMIAGISFKPPLVCVSLSHHSYTRDLVEQSNELAFNFVSSEYVDLAKKIGFSTGRKINKFEEYNLEIFTAETISSPLLKIAHEILECKVENKIDLGLQSLYIARVLAYHRNTTEDKSPLYLYHGKFYSIGENIGSFRG